VVQVAHTLVIRNLEMLVVVAVADHKLAEQAVRALMNKEMQAVG
jgi:hypothetical protein